VRYVFDPEVVHECGLAGLGLKKPEMFDAVAKALETRYPGHIDHGQPWIYSIAGGAMIQMKLYFASVMEYMMIWGTPIGSEGHSGRHHVGFWDTVLDGEAWYFGEGEFERTIYKPGDRIWVGPRQARGMNFTQGVWALEYARGPLPLSIPFGLADEILSTLDFPTALRTLGIYMSLVGRHWNNAEAPGLTALRPLKKVGAVIPSFLGPRLTNWLAPPPETGGIPDGRGNIRLR
jgi:hypothetical protein